jgi:hypothetical protein
VKRPNLGSIFDPRVREAFGFAAALSAVVALCGLTLQEIHSRNLESETRAFVQQSIGESSRWVADVIQEELQARIRTIRSVQPLISKAGPEPSMVLIEPAPAQAEGVVAAASVPVVSDSTHWVSLELDPEWLAVGTWREGQNSSLIRVSVGINSRNPDRPGGLPERLATLSPEVDAALRRAFKGEGSAVGDWKVDPHGMLALVLPGPEPGSAVMGWTQMGKLQKWFKADRWIQLALLDRNGKTLADAAVAGTAVGGPAAQRNPLWEAARGPEFLRLTQHQQAYEDVSGQPFFGGFHRVGEGQLLVLASLDAREAMAGVRASRVRSFMLLGIITGVCFWVAFLADLGVLFGSMKLPSIFRRRKTSSAAASASPEEKPATSPDAPTEGGTPSVLEHSPVYLFAAGLNELVELGERERPEELHQTVNDFFVIGRSLAKEFGGQMIPTGGASWGIFWAMHPENSEQRVRPIRAALELRKTMAALNEARKVDGHQALQYSMGVHCAAEWIGAVGEVGSRRVQPMGGVYGPATTLRELAQHAGLDLLISESVRQGLEEVLLTQSVGERKLSQVSGLTALYAVEGYRDGSGAEVRTWTSYSGSIEEARKKTAPEAAATATAQRWFVNNGSKILGPMDASAIASALFTQEIDFDSECWREGTGESSLIRSCGLFSETEDSEAQLWVYDGTQLHGPMTKGFLQTALTSGAISLEHSVCEGSTVHGWTLISDWKKGKSGPPPFKPSDEHAESESPRKAA